ncbi:hypothetical protein EV401DRAFT_1980329 [Pisolithus croceorrhizus]|nr:hypothetical protein EV401DRAFT_1980329 [Pisolithus croceorrhizus]
MQLFLNTSSALQVLLGTSLPTRVCCEVCSMPSGIGETCTASVKAGEVHQCHSRLELMIRVSFPKTKFRNVSAAIVVSYISLASCHPGTSPNSHNQSTCLQTPHHRVP